MRSAPARKDCYVGPIFIGIGSIAAVIAVRTCAFRPRDPHGAATAARPVAFGSCAGLQPPVGKQAARAPLRNSDLMSAIGAGGLLVQCPVSSGPTLRAGFTRENPANRGVPNLWDTALVLWSPAAIRPSTDGRHPAYPIGNLRSLAPIPYAAPSWGQDTGPRHPYRPGAAWATAT